MRRTLLLLSVCSAPLLAQGSAQTEAWQIILPPQASIVFARDGSLIGEVGAESRFSVPIRSLPRYVGEAFVAVEDQRFYQHDGVDLVGVAAAIKDNLLGDRRGASTITQQLVGNLHPDLIDRRDRSLGRKLKEQSAAREMEKHYSKEQILEAYLNDIDYGHGWGGIEMAARHYFAKGAARLTLAEAATLAALPKGPAVYDPIKFPERARARRNVVLGLMAEQGYITRDQAVAAQREALVVAPNLGRSVVAPYFVDAVRQIAEHEGVNLSAGGYRVFTTLEPALQRAANDALVQGVAAVEARDGYRYPKMSALPRDRDDYLQGLVVAVDPFTGDVRALVGGRDYARSPFNRATYAMRQPGSAIKPFVYARAIMDSIPANAIINDTVLAIPLPNGDVYSPDNADNQFMGPITMREALVHSRNTVAVQLAERVTLDSVAALVQRVGIETPFQPYPSSAIGASVVRPVDFVAAYSAFATNGVAVEPRYITRIEDRSGRVVYDAPNPEPRRVMDPRVAFIVRNMMRDVVERGTGATARRMVPNQIAIAGKTGTTNDNADVWFMGVTPSLVAGVWLGFDKPKTIMPGAAGGSLAAPIWANMVTQYYGSGTAGDWFAPGDLSSGELDRATGQLADSLTPPDRRYTEYFIPGTEPPLLRIDPWKIPQWGPFITH
ncbi:MAG TPA: PBP1A family penicillin-binding protein [Gemmatimonadaceae bacterium]|nr:PBP1A family penicillin-binding protein [Gemmatimonadaceae bacterium]